MQKLIVYSLQLIAIVMTKFKTIDFRADVYKRQIYYCLMDVTNIFTQGKHFARHTDTCLENAHLENFSSMEEKCREKLDVYKRQPIPISYGPSEDESSSMTSPSDTWNCVKFIVNSL